MIYPMRRAGYGHSEATLDNADDAPAHAVARTAGEEREGADEVPRQLECGGLPPAPVYRPA